jgi:hypothetical protein
MLCFRAPRVLRDGPDSGDEEDGGRASSHARAGPAALTPHKLLGPASPARGLSPARVSSGRTRALPGRAVRVSGDSGRGSRARPSTPPPLTPVRRSPTAPLARRSTPPLNLTYASSQPLHLQPLHLAAAPAAGEASQGGRRRGASSPARKPGPAAAVRSPARDANGRCDKCDGDHDTDACPHYPRARDEHPDATRRSAMGGMGGSGGKFTLRNARVVRQPGDGDCLYHSLSYGLGARGCTASVLRRELAAWVAAHPGERIADTPLSDWVRWDSGLSCGEYAQRMARSGWGGGVEMAAFARLKRANVHVYERRTGLLPGFKRISCFDAPPSAGDAPDATLAKTVHVLYGGGVHYDLLEPSGSSLGGAWELRL